MKKLLVVYFCLFLFGCNSSEERCVGIVKTFEVKKSWNGVVSAIVFDEKGNKYYISSGAGNIHTGSRLIEITFFGGEKGIIIE